MRRRGWDRKRDRACRRIRNAAPGASTSELLRHIPTDYAAWRRRRARLQTVAILAVLLPVLSLVISAFVVMTFGAPGFGGTP